MTSLRDIEQAFEDLKRNLRGSTSVRQLLKQLDHFVGFFEEKDNRIESYLLELADHLPQLNDPMSITGIDPLNFDQLRRRLKAAKDHFSTLENHPRFERFIEQLRRMIALQFAFTGEPVKAIEALDCDLDDALKIRLERWLSRTEDAPYQLLRKCIRIAREVEGHKFSELQKLMEQWEQCRNPGREIGWGSTPFHSVLIPTVEDLQFLEGNDFHLGRLRRLSIELFEVSEEATDRLTTNFLQQGKKEDGKTMERAILAARTLLREEFPRVSNMGFRGRFSFTYPQWTHRGKSLQLAAAGLLYGAVQHKLNHRRRYMLKPAAAITGLMDEQGGVREVDTRTLPAKVEAAFFSWTEILVVPDDQRSIVRREVKRLQERYPNRSLEFFGVNRLRDLFFDRRVSVYKQDSLTRYYGKKVWQTKGKIIAGLLIPALALVSLYLYIGPLNQNPAHVSIDGNNFVIKNKFGRTLTRLPSGINLEKQSFRNTISDPHGMIKLRDITGDGIRDIFWFREINSDTLETSLLTALNYKTGKKIWQKKLSYRFDFKHKLDPHPNRFRGTQIEFLASNDPDSLQMLILARHINYFPSVVERLNPYNGEKQAVYLNFGFLRWMTLMDLDNNGRKEILVTGESNAWEQPIVAVLDPFLMKGHAPTTEEYRIRNMKKAAEIAYWRIPATRIMRLSDDFYKWNFGHHITSIGNEESFKVDIYSRFKDRWNARSGYGFINLFFSTNLKLKRVATTDFFDQLVEKLERKNRLKSRFSTQIFRNYADSLYYWSESGWQHEPVINAHYIEERKSVRKPSYQRTQLD